MTPRIIWSLLACLVGVASCVHAEEVAVPGPYKWDGQASPSLVTDAINWVGGIAPDPELGLFDAVFGELITDAGLVEQSVVFQQLESGQTVVPVSIGNLLFETGRPTYTFTSGATLDPLVPDLRLVGDVLVQSGPVVIFDAGLSVVLDDGQHGVDVAGEATLDFRGDISEQGFEGASIVKTGAGTLILGSAPGGRSTFSGGFELREGRLVIGRSSFIEENGDVTSPVGVGTLTLFDNTTLAVALLEPDIPVPDGIFLTNTIALPSGTAFIETEMTDLILAGLIEGDTGRIEKLGAGKLTLSNSDSSFSGGVTVSEGTLALNASSWSEGDFFAGPAGTGTITLADGTTLTSGMSVSINNPVEITSGSVTLGVPEEPESKLTLTGPINGTADLIVAGQVELKGVSNLTGDVTVGSGAELTLGTANALRPDVRLSLLTESLLNINFNQTIERFIGSDVLAEIAIASGAEFTIDLGTSEGGTTFYGDISGAGSLRIAGSSNGHAVVLAGDNFYTGGTFIEPGAKLQIGDGESSSSIASNIFNDGFLYLRGGVDEEQPLVIDSVVSGTGSVVIDGGVTKLAGNNAYIGGTVITGGATVIAASAAGHNPFGDPAWEGNAVTVNAGAILALDGATVSNSLILNAGSRLAGNGFVSSAIIGSGVTLAPEGAGTDTIGTLVFDDLTLGGGGIYEWNLLDPNNHLSGYDRAEIEISSASLHIDSSIENPFEIRLITLDGPGSRGLVSLQNQTYTWYLVDAAGSAIHSPGEAFDPALFHINTELFETNVLFDQNSFSIFIDNNRLALSFTPVPEPSTYALMALGLAGLGVRAWRRHRRRR